MKFRANLLAFVSKLDSFALKAKILILEKCNSLQKQMITSTKNIYKIDSWKLRNKATSIFTQLIGLQNLGFYSQSLIFFFTYELAQ